MKNILLLLAAIMAMSCTGNKTQTCQSEKGIDSTIVETMYVTESKLLYDTLFSLIEKNKTGAIKNDEFKPKADLAKQKIDSINLLMDSYDKSVVKEYGNKLLDDLSKKLSK